MQLSTTTVRANNARHLTDSKNSMTYGRTHIGPERPFVLTNWVDFTFIIASCTKLLTKLNVDSIKYIINQISLSLFKLV